MVMRKRSRGVLERLATDEVLTILQEYMNIPCFLQNMPAHGSEKFVLESQEFRATAERMGQGGSPECLTKNVTIIFHSDLGPE